MQDVAHARHPIRCSLQQAFYWILAQPTKQLNSVSKRNPHEEGKAEEMAVTVVDKLVRKCHKIEQAYRRGICSERKLHSLESCTRNVQLRSSQPLMANTQRQFTVSARMLQRGQLPVFKIKCGSMKVNKRTCLQ